MAVAEELQIIVDAKVNQAIRDMNRVDRSISGTATTTNKLSDTFKKLAGPVAIGAVVLGLAKMSKELINAASDAEETGNKFNVVFASVADEAEAAADRIKDEFKLSDETVQNFLSGVGDITSGLGATSEQALQAAEDITTLGLDINSFANLSGGAEQAVKALTSLFTGEREAAKALGIVINDTNLKAYAEGMGKVFKELTPLEKGFLSLELATKQSTLAIGDFARSSDSYANTAKAAAEATKDLKAALGVSLLPTATAGVGIFTELASKMAEVVKQHNELQSIVGRFEEGNATAQDRVDIAENEIVILNDKIRAQRKIYDNIKDQNAETRILKQEQLEALTALINQLQTAKEIKWHYEGIAKEAKTIADAEKARLAEIQRIATLELDASELLDSRRKARLTDEELLLESLQDQIDLWVQFREVAGVQELLNDLVRERNELLKEMKPTLEDNKQTHAEMVAEAMFDLRAYASVSKEVAEEATMTWQSMYASISSLASGFFGGLDSLASASSATELQRLKDQGASQETLDKKKKEIAHNEAVRKKALGILNVGIDTASAIIAMLAVGPAGIPLSIAAGVVGGIQLAAVAASPIPAFAEGGSFVTKGAMPIMVGDNVGGREEVTVKPVSSNGANVSNEPSGAVILQVGADDLIAWWNKTAEDGHFRLPRRAIV